MSGACLDRLLDVARTAFLSLYTFVNWIVQVLVSLLGLLLLCSCCDYVSCCLGVDLNVDSIYTLIMISDGNSWGIPSVVKKDLKAEQAPFKGYIIF